MFRLALLPLSLSLLLSCCGAHAACGVSASDAGTLSITVAGGRCFESAQQRTAFAAELKSAVGAMSPQRSRAGNDIGQPGRISGFHRLQAQPGYPNGQRGPVYYGQRQ